MRPLNRPPLLHDVDKINIPQIKQQDTDHGITMYQIRKPKCNVVKAEIVILAGRPYEHKKLASSCCAHLFREGTQRLESWEISEKIDLLGATLQVKASLDTIEIQLVSLPKHFIAAMDVLGELLKEVSFPEQELQHMVRRKIQKLKVDRSKNDVESYRILTEAIFGADHPYGYNSSEELFMQISRDDIVRHYENNFHSANCTAFLTGDIDESMIERFAILLQRTIPYSRTPSVISPIMQNGDLPQAHGDSLFVEGSEQQNSIKIGRRLFARNHPDYRNFAFTSTLLGGYFGSRLVSNLRESKGYTYGIYSMIDTMKHDGFFMISTDVAPRNTQVALQEIYAEMALLQEEKVDEAELALVKNYLTGLYLSLFDGPFKSMKVVKALIMSDVPLSVIDNVVARTKAITAEEVQKIAKQYFNRNDFWEVVVGKDFQAATNTL